MNKSLLQKYKPEKLEEIHLNDYYKKLINIYLNNDKLFFLIQGNCCVGKTSLINVLLNIYYTNSNVEENVLFFNILKDQGINYYRNELKNYCQINNMLNNVKKTVVIDDLDLLNEQSQQFFYTLINNFKNINFILSCNNINKIDHNIIQKLEVLKIENTDKTFLEKILKNINYHENIQMSTYNLNEIINSSNYCIPKMINILEKILIYNNNIANIYSDKKEEIHLNDKIDYESLNLQIQELHIYLDLCKNNNLIEAIKFINNINNSGYSVIDILDELVNFVKFYSEFEDEYKYKILKILLKYINIFNNQHEDEIELIFLTNNLIEIF